jgi:hypothetical protein
MWRGPQLPSCYLLPCLAAFLAVEWLSVDPFVPLSFGRDAVELAPLPVAA